MSYINPIFRHPELPTNALGLTRSDYEGSLSTLCAGCGHDSVSNAIINACFELSLPPHRIAKMSGIGCSSKTPTYFLNKAHGFNSVHGRMPSVAAGANMANRNLTYIGVSGDGDTASIGFGQFGHVIRRNLNMMYVVENNGCYGLTKGQDSATADVGSVSKAGSENPYEPIDLVSMAIQLGATFVARSFSGDKAQLVPLMKAALTHKGFAFIDVISPCVTFNNNAGSTKAYDYVREHLEATATVDFVASRDGISVDYPEGSSRKVPMYDGSFMHLHKLDSHDWDPTNKRKACEALLQAKEDDTILTGLLYVDEHSKDLHEVVNTVPRPLNELTQADLLPSSEQLAAINNQFR